jgi:acyl dehydratase
MLAGPCIRLEAQVTAEEIKEFGNQYDPQPFHLDEAAGEGSFFKGLAASGWLTAAIVMRLRIETIKVSGPSALVLRSYDGPNQFGWAIQSARSLR